MLTRRQVLTGTAASSIAAIASARGMAAAPAADVGFNVGFGNLEGGAATVFHKDELGFSFFLKVTDSVAQIFYKEQLAGEISVFLKYMPKAFLKEDVERAFRKADWQLVDQFGGFLKGAASAEAGFLKVTSSLAQLFVKYEDADQRSVQDVRTLQGGVLVPDANVCGIKIE